jgi:hypothetical protein
MGIDSKYGRVTTELGTIGEDEPVVVFRAQDATMVEVLQRYHLICLKAGSPRRHLLAILDAIENVKNWQSRNRTQTPTSDGYTPDQGWEGKTNPFPA